MLALRPRLSLQRGLSLVELMVGIAIGMFVVAAAATLVATQLVDNRRLLLEVQVQQDLRAAADIITRELRRAGASGNVDGALGLISINGSAAGLNPLSDVTPLNGITDTAVEYSSSRTVGQTGPYGFRLINHVIQSQLAALAGWQALTDEATMKVTAFNITAQNQTPIRAACTKLCIMPPPAPNPNPPGVTPYWCWPTVTVRTFIIDMTGVSASDPSVQRSIHSVVRLQNDQVLFNDLNNPLLACPA